MYIISSVFRGSGVTHFLLFWDKWVFRFSSNFLGRFFSISFLFVDRLCSNLDMFQSKGSLFLYDVNVISGSLFLSKKQQGRVTPIWTLYYFKDLYGHQLAFIFTNRRMLRYALFQDLISPNHIGRSGVYRDTPFRRNVCLETMTYV